MISDLQDTGGAGSPRPADMSMVQVQFDSVDFPRAVVDALDELDDRVSTLECEAERRDRSASMSVVEASLRQASQGIRTDVDQIIYARQSEWSGFGGLTIKRSELKSLLDDAIAIRLGSLEIALKRALCKVAPAAESAS